MFRQLHSAWQVSAPFPVGATHRHARAALSTATAHICPLEVGCVSRCPPVVSIVPTVVGWGHNIPKLGLALHPQGTHVTPVLL